MNSVTRDRIIPSIQRYFATQPIAKAWLFGSYSRGEESADSDVDILTAKNAGVPCLSVTWGFRDEKTLEAAGGRYFCRKPAQLQEKLEQIMRQIYLMLSIVKWEIN